MPLEMSSYGSSCDHAKANEYKQNVYTVHPKSVTYIKDECWCRGIIFQADIGKNLHHVTLTSSHISQPYRYIHARKNKQISIYCDGLVIHLPNG